MSIPFTQFMMPKGRREQVSITRPNEIESMAQALIKAGFVFEIEMLSDYKTVSMECCDPKTERVLSSAICHNGPSADGKLGVPESVDKIITQSYNLERLAEKCL